MLISVFQLFGTYLVSPSHTFKNLLIPLQGMVDEHKLLHLGTAHTDVILTQ